MGATTAGAPPVVFQGVTKRYAGSDAPAISGLDLEIGGGEICVLVGPSGSGKTTAMRMVNRMVDITEGDILVGGTSVRDRSPSSGSWAAPRGRASSGASPPRRWSARPDAPGHSPDHLYRSDGGG